MSEVRPETAPLSQIASVIFPSLTRNADTTICIVARLTLQRRKPEEAHCQKFIILPALHFNSGNQSTGSQSVFSGTNAFDHHAKQRSHPRIYCDAVHFNTCKFLVATSRNIVFPKSLKRGSLHQGSERIYPILRKKSMNST